MGTPGIVLDEPTTGQDANGVERVKRIVGELADVQGKPADIGGYYLPGSPDFALIDAAIAVQMLP